MTFVAISTVTYPAEHATDVKSVGLAMVPIARKQPGFVSIAFHQSTDQNATMMYWEWQSEADHLACQQSQDWSELMQHSGSVFQSEGIDFSIQTFERIG